METSSHCIVSTPRVRWSLWPLLPLTVFVLLVHGYHPWAEDGGMYVAGVEHSLHPALFPQYTDFATAQRHYSLFAPIVAGLARLTRLSLPATLFSLYLLSIALTLLATHRLAQSCFRVPSAQWTAVTLVASWWTLPIAATSLSLMDPYLTARSLSTPLSLLALDAALVLGPLSRRSTARCAFFLTLAACFHPLMAAYALALIVCLRLVLGRARFRTWAVLVACLFLLATIFQLAAQPEPPAALAADHSRYYWFLAQWHIYEWLGLLAPLALFAFFARRPRTSPSRTDRHETARAAALARAALISCTLALSLALLFAQERSTAHPIARLQPLRCFLLPYALLILLLGGAITLPFLTFTSPARTRLLSPGPFFAALLAVPLFLAQRATFPSSLHLELPGRTNPNPWAQAFRWARDHTPPNALFALDARYINTPGEDAQSFRAIALRSAVPDFSKDGGEAANQPVLAPEWQRSARATRDLSTLTDPERDARLRPFGVDWVVLHASAATAHPCPYRNAVVKVCRLR